MVFYTFWVVARNKKIITKARNMENTKIIDSVFRGFVLSCFRDKGVHHPSPFTHGIIYILMGANGNLFLSNNLN
jgi:hypothetical protein